MIGNVHGVGYGAVHIGARVTRQLARRRVAVGRQVAVPTGRIPTVLVRRRGARALVLGPRNILVGADGKSYVSRWLCVVVAEQAHGGGGHGRGCVHTHGFVVPDVHQASLVTCTELGVCGMTVSHHIVPNSLDVGQVVHTQVMQGVQEKNARNPGCEGQSGEQGV